MSDGKNWLLVKRDLYERPDHMGYTGIRDNAGRYTEAEAKDSVRDGQYGVSMIREDEAPEFTKACFDDLARAHLKAKNAEAAGYAERLAISLWEKHYKHYSPQWKPLSGDLIGILTQIDNMTAALVPAQATEKAA